MQYQVSEKTGKALEAVVSHLKVKEALQFQEDDQEEIIQKQMELTLIPAPTFHEEKKAARLLEMFREEGLDAHIDEYGNVCGVRKGTGGGKNVLIEGHMDTVFPLDTKLEITRKDGFIHCPGIVDDTRGCVSVLSVLRAMNKAGIETAGDIHFVTTVQEEGMGALKGMQYYCQHHPELQASISVDGGSFRQVIYEATGIQTYEINFYGTGGHAFSSYGLVANPLHAAGRAIAEIAEIRVPEFPKTTVEVTGCFAGSYASIHAIVQKATVLLNFRSNDQQELMKLKEKIFNAVERACREETERWGKDVITYDYRHVCDVNAGNQDSHAPIVEAAMAISNFLGCEEPALAEGGSTNCNRALEAGLPAVCLGMGELYDTKCHTLQEQFMEEEAFKGCQQVLILALLCAGFDGMESIIS